MQTAYSYTRFSRLTLTTTSKLRWQERKAREYATANGLVLDEGLSLQDMGVSAYRGANIKFGRLGVFLSAVKAGYIEKGSYLLIENLDRLSRDTLRKALRTLEDICDEGITVVTLMDNQKYTAEILDRDPAALLISLVVFLRANEESNTKSERSSFVHENNLLRVAQGEKVILSGHLPAWLKREGDEVVVDQKKAESLKLIFKLAESGLGPAAIAKSLNYQKIRLISSAKYWRAAAIWEILRKESTIGIYRQRNLDKKSASASAKDHGKIRGYYPRVISQKRWNGVQAILNKRTRNSGLDERPKKKTRVIFAQLAKCPQCGDAMGPWSLRPNAGNHFLGEQILTCQRSTMAAGCNRVFVEYAPLEKAFLEFGPSMMRAHVGKPNSGSSLAANNLISAKIEETIIIICEPKLDRKQLNRKLRDLFYRVIIDFNSMALHFEWSSGGKTKIPISNLTKILHLSEIEPGKPKGIYLEKAKID